MAYLSTKEHRPSGTIGGEQEHGSNAKKNCREWLAGKRPSGLFVGEGRMLNELLGSNGERPKYIVWQREEEVQRIVRGRGREA